MLRKLLSVVVLLFVSKVSAQAGHYHHYFHAYPAYPVAAVVAYPVTVAPAPVFYQPAFVVPTPTAVYAPMVPTVPAYHAPPYSTAGYYLAPSAAYVHPVGFGYGRRGFDEVEVELKYRRDGGFRYKVDYDD